MNKKIKKYLDEIAKTEKKMCIRDSVSYVVTDPKGTIIVECGKMLVNGGYRTVSYTHLDVYKRQE